ncbi:MAG: thioesterase domain-containing protein [Novosphingobium sp.]
MSMTETFAASDRCIIRPRPDSLAEVRLFCIAAAGSAASSFFDWGRLLPQGVELCAIQLPGRQQRAGERAYTRMPLALQEVRKAIAGYLDRPFGIFGTCTGSLLGYELAQRLRNEPGAQMLGLYVSCCRAPHLPDRDAPIHALGDDALWAEVERLGGTPAMVLERPELRAMLEPTLRADFEMAETYHYRVAEPLDCPITVFGGAQDTIVSRDELEGWREHTTADCNVRLIDGGHYLLDSAADELTRLISASLLAAAA